jgi:hypothetical protein
VTDLERAFEEFDRANPRVYELLCQFADRAISAGRMRLGAKLIWERLRWEIYVESVSNDDFRLNNNHTAYYARKWLRDHPEYPEFFETRIVKGERGAHWRFDEEGQGDFFDE